MPPCLERVDEGDVERGMPVRKSTRTRQYLRPPRFFPQPLSTIIMTFLCDTCACRGMVLHGVQRAGRREGRPGGGGGCDRVYSRYRAEITTEDRYLYVAGVPWQPTAAARVHDR